MDLTLLSALLQELLIKNKRVALPGMGTFVLEDLPSVFLLDGRAITPPSKKVYFRTAEIKNDGALEGAYARKHGVSAEKAREAVSLLIKEIRATLIESMKVNIPNFGSISFGESYSFVFTMDDHFNVSPDTYPLEAISLKPEIAGAGVIMQEPHMDDKRVDPVGVQEDELRRKSYNDIISEWHKAAQVPEEEEFPKVTMQVSEQAGVVDDRMSDPPKYDYGAVDKGPDDLMIGNEEVERLKEDIAEKQDEFSADFVLDEVGTVQKMTEIYEAEGAFAHKPDDDCDEGYEVVDLSAMEVQTADIAMQTWNMPAAEKVQEDVGGMYGAGSGVVSGVVSETERVEKKEKQDQKEEKELKERKLKEERELKERKLKEERELKERKAREKQELRAKAKQEKEALMGEKKPFKINKWIWILLIAVVLVLGLLCAVYFFREDLRPVLEKLLYSKEELEILRKTGRI